MAIPNCPHCYRRTIPMADGACPSCGKNVNDRSGVDSAKSLVGICPGDVLPPICHVCGASTRRLHKLMVASEPQDLTFTPGLMTAILLSFFRPLGFLAALERECKTIKLQLKLPTCDQCARKVRRICPHYIDFDAKRIDLVVHTEFRKALNAAAA